MSNTGHHGGHMHSSHGGEGAVSHHSVGVAQGQHHHGFLSHLLGLDHEVHHAHLPHQGANVHQSTQASSNLPNPLQAVKLSDVFQGINVTPNMMFLVLFAGFALWLGVIYWVRHHEPFANQVLRNPGGYSPTAQADRQLVAKTRYAVPIRTGSSTGAVYVPGAGADSEVTGLSGQLPPASSGAPMPPAPPASSDTPLLSAPPAPSLPAGYPAGAAGSSSGSTGSASQMMPPLLAGKAFAPVSGTYVIPVQTADGLRVKTITNR